MRLKIIRNARIKICVNIIHAWIILLIILLIIFKRTRSKSQSTQEITESQPREYSILASNGDGGTVAASAGCGVDGQERYGTPWLQFRKDLNLRSGRQWGGQQPAGVADELLVDFDRLTIRNIPVP